MNPTLLSRNEFESKSFQRTNGQCIIPWCEKDAVDAHHIIERELWDNGGYYLQNAANVCSTHHYDAEEDYIPPQAFWDWHNVTPHTPSGYGIHIDKWGNNFNHPPNQFTQLDIGHLPFSSDWSGSENDFQELSRLTELPLILIPLQSSTLEFKTIEQQTYLTDSSELPLAAYNHTYDVWLSWPETTGAMRQIQEVQYDEEYEFYTDLREHVAKLDHGNGVLIRAKYPFHHSQFLDRLALY